MQDKVWARLKERKRMEKKRERGTDRKGGFGGKRGNGAFSPHLVLWIRNRKMLYIHLHFADNLRGALPGQSSYLRKHGSLKTVPSICSSESKLAGKWVAHLHWGSPQKKPFVFLQMVINNTMLQVFKDPETITFYFLLTPNHRGLSNWNGVQLAVAIFINFQV